jgi:hypothetical protein
MKPEKQRIAIAEYCGQDRDCLNSLDAMHEAESHIKDKYAYRRHLWLQAWEDPSNRSNEPAFTTAAQRAEAFLRTVGRWEQ